MTPGQSQGMITTMVQPPSTAEELAHVLTNKRRLGASEDPRKVRKAVLELRQRRAIAVARRHQAAAQAHLAMRLQRQWYCERQYAARLAYAAAAAERRAVAAERREREAAQQLAIWHEHGGSTMENPPPAEPWIMELKKQVESLEAENAKLRCRLERYESNVLDLTADVEAPPLRSTLRELHDKETTRRVAQIKKERDDHESRCELLDSMVTPLEDQRRQLQDIVSTAAKALMERDVPTRMLADGATPFYYAQNSWDVEQEVPWNAEADRPLSLAEGIAWVHDNAKPPRKRRR